MLTFEQLINPMTLDDFYEIYHRKRWCVIPANNFRKDLFSKTLTWKQFSQYINNDRAVSGLQATTRPFQSSPNTVNVVPLEDSEISGNNGIDTTAIQVVAQNQYDAVTATAYSSFGIDCAYCANFDCLYSINKDGLLSVSY